MPYFFLAKGLLEFLEITDKVKLFNMKYEKVGLITPQILLPGKDYETWATIACDQYTSQKDVWEDMEKLVADKPSTLRLMLPEVYLDDEDVDARREKINESMREYIKDGVFRETVDSMIFVERETSSGTRLGIVTAVDLDEYDYSADSTALIRSTEETIPDRLPPRVEIRMKAELEMPHIMILIDDSEHTVQRPMADNMDKGEKLYDFDLMTGGGNIKGYKVSDETARDIAEKLNELKIKNDGLLYAVGDGNHSLATAKECWEAQKRTGILNEKAKYALVEIVNLHDDALEFEPIHRVLYNCSKDTLTKFKKTLYSLAGKKGKREVTYVFDGHEGSFKIPDDKLSVSYIEAAVDEFIAQNDEVKVDYVHGDDVAQSLGMMDGTLSIILPPFDKNLLFKTVAKFGQLPRKSFSMGHARDKRYYIETRKIR